MESPEASLEERVSKLETEMVTANRLIAQIQARLALVEGLRTDIDAANARIAEVRTSAVKLGDWIRLNDETHGNCLGTAPPHDGKVMALVAPCGVPSTKWKVLGP